MWHSLQRNTQTQEDCTPHTRTRLYSVPTHTHHTHYHQLQSENGKWCCKDMKDDYINLKKTMKDFEDIHTYRKGVDKAIVLLLHWYFLVLILFPVAYFQQRKLDHNFSFKLKTVCSLLQYYPYDTQYRNEVSTKTDKNDRCFYNMNRWRQIHGRLQTNDMNRWRQRWKDR